MLQVKIIFTMKTFTTSFTAIIFALSILTSCGVAALDIDVSELEEPCDFADAMLTCMEEVSELVGDDDYDDLKGDDKKMAEKLMKKVEKIKKAISKEANKDDDFLDDVEDCDSFKEFEEILGDLDIRVAALDIDVSELEEPCDFADAMLSVRTEMNALMGEVKEGEEQTPEFQALTKKAEVLMRMVNVKDIDYKALYACPSMKELTELNEKAEKKTEQATYKKNNKVRKDMQKVENEPCDFADAMLAVATEMNALKGELKEGEEPTSEQEESMMVLMNKMKDVQVAAQNADLGPDDMQNCPSMNELNKL